MNGFGQVMDLQALRFDPRMNMSGQLMSQGLDSSPIRHPLQGVSRMAQALLGAKMYQDMIGQRQAALQQEQMKQQAQRQALSQLINPEMRTLETNIPIPEQEADFSNVSMHGQPAVDLRVQGQTRGFSPDPNELAQVRGVPGMESATGRFTPSQMAQALMQKRMGSQGPIGYGPVDRAFTTQDDTAQFQGKPFQPVTGGVFKGPQNKMNANQVYEGVGKDPGGAFSALNNFQDTIRPPDLVKKERGPVQSMQERLAEYVNAGGDPVAGMELLKMQQEFQRGPERKIIKGADGRNYYVDTQEPVLPGVQQAVKPPETRVIEKGGNKVTQQWNPQTKSFEEIATAPRFSQEGPKTVSPNDITDDGFLLERQVDGTIKKTRVLEPDAAKKLKDSKLATGKTEIFENGASVAVLKDGTTQVTDPSGKVVEGKERLKALKDAVDTKLRLARTTSAEKAAGKAAVEMSSKAVDQIANVKKSISNIDDAIRLLEEGAGTGPIVSKLPSMRSASIELDNVQAQMGLDVIGNTTFGALSESELQFALSAALPTGLPEPELKQWLERKRDAQRKLADYLEDAAIFLGVPGNTVADWVEQQRAAREALGESGEVGQGGQGEGEQGGQEQIFYYDMKSGRVNPDRRKR